MRGIKLEIESNIINFATVDGASGLLGLWFETETIEIDEVVGHCRVTLIWLCQAEIACVATIKAVISIQADNGGFKEVCGE